MKPERNFPTELKNLILTDGPAITLVTAADENGSTRIQTKLALDRLRRAAKDMGKEALALVESIEGDAMNVTGHTAFLRSPSVNMTFEVEKTVAPVSILANRFDARTLLCIADCQKSFHILAISQKRTRI